MRHLRALILVLSVAATMPAAAQTPVPQTAPRVSALAAHQSLTLAGAQVVLDAATFEARRLGVGGSFAVVDAGGNLLALSRLDGTFAASALVAYGKARTAALFQKPTRVFEETINRGRFTMTALDDFTPLQGGVPLVVAGEIVGAVGVSGSMSAQQDDDLASIGAGAVATAASPQAGGGQ
jgi:glc operon protein GlcG